MMIMHANSTDQFDVDLNTDNSLRMAKAMDMTATVAVLRYCAQPG